MHIFKSIHKGYTTLEDIETEQIELKRDLGRTKQGDPKDKSQEQNASAQEQVQVLVLHFHCVQAL